MSSYSEQFLKQNPLAVLGVLRDLQKGEVPLRISWSNNQFISKILDVSQERLIVDLGSQEYENRAALRAEHIAVMAETHGAKVEFVLPRLELSEYQGLPATGRESLGDGRNAGGESRVCAASSDHDRVPGFACVYRSPAR